MTRPSSQKGLHVPSERESLEQHTIVRLGEREREVLEILWTKGGATVQNVADRLKTNLLLLDQEAASSPRTRLPGSASILLVLIGTTAPLLPLVVVPLHECAEYLLYLG